MSGTVGKNAGRASGIVGAGDIGADAVSSSNIADDAIDSEHYTDGSIDNAHIADDAIDSEHYTDGSIDNAHIADDAIDSEHYVDGSIDNAHIADDAIDSEHYAAGSIDEAHIANDAVNFSTHLKAGTDGELITWDASGDPAVVAVGTSTHILTSNGSGAAPTFTAFPVATVHTWTAGQRGEITALSDGATITPDFADSNDFSVTLGGNRTLANPSNLTAGQSGSIFVTQDGTGSQTLAYGSYWDFVGGTAPTLTTTADKIDRIDYVVRTTGSIHAVASLDLS